MKVLPNPPRNKDLGVRAEGEPGRIKEPEVSFSKPLIHHLACQAVFWVRAIVHKPRSFSALLLSRLAIEKSPFHFSLSLLFGLKAAFSPTPLTWLQEAQETLFVLGTVF